MNELSDEIHRKVIRAQQGVERVGQALTVLNTELSKGWLCYLVAKTIHQVYADKRIRCLYYFFATTYISCGNSAILALTNVASSDQEKKYRTANIHYLLCQFEAAIRTAAKLTEKFTRSSIISQLPDSSERSSVTLAHLFDAPHKSVMESISEYRQQLESLRPVIEKLEERRSKIVAHLDRKLVNDPATVLSHPLHSNEIEHAFDVLFNIIKGCYWYLGSALALDILERGLSEDFEYLIGLVERDNERP